MNKYSLFILTYQGIDELASWFEPSKFDIPVYIIDNGKQKIPERLKNYIIHSTEENIFCSGGMNLCTSIGFDYLKSEKILLTQDDAKFTNTDVKTVLEATTENCIVGGRNDWWYYCFLGLHKAVYNKVGKFDENYLYGTCEDNDFHFRSLLLGVQHKTANLYIPNKNLSSPAISHKYGNYEYLIEKWGPEKSWGVYTYTTPFNGVEYPKFRNEYWSQFTKRHDRFMSEVEYERFLVKQ